MEQPSSVEINKTILVNTFKVSLKEGIELYLVSVFNSNNK